ncbi:hypothetical protein DTO207G8_7386 [Paecilomyces variotii]|nr:hypothetical protein DTO207G8_7386 [Paecilomyces variotii]KAJ9288658.1 hypothetical protein DTO021C3_3687 [Paecilomyces variotii]
MEATFSKTNEVPMTQNEQSFYIPTHEYTSGAPSQPQVAMAPAMPFYEDDPARFDTMAPESHDFEIGEFASAEFFNSVSMSDFIDRAKPIEWSYEMRRVAQLILPFLYLGPSSSLKDRDFLRTEGITLLLAIRSRQSAQARLVSGEKVAAELGIEADAIDVMDNQELIAAFPRAIRRINDHIAFSPHRKVLVFCESGNERSASVVIAYLMVMLNLDTVNALYTVQHRRFCVCIEEPMRILLASFESILDAKRDVAKAKRMVSSSNGMNPQVQASKKRSLSQQNETDDQEQGDTDMDMDTDRFYDRNPSAPFQDR